MKIEKKILIVSQFKEGDIVVSIENKKYVIIKKYFYRCGGVKKYRVAFLGERCTRIICFDNVNEYERTVYRIIDNKG